MTESSGAETSGNVILDLTRDLNRMGTTPGWKIIRESAFSDSAQRRNGLLRVLRGAKLLRPVTAGMVEHALAAKGTDKRDFQEARITHTIAFAKNMLEAEAAAHERATIQGLDIADISPTGEHAVWKSRSKQSQRNGEQVKMSVKKVIDGREHLPVAKPDGIRLTSPDLNLFYGIAELYGMARAGYDPQKLPDYLFGSGVIGVNERTQRFLANHGRILEILYEEDPLERMAALHVDVPQAVEVADFPSVATMMSAAHQVASSQV